jgi:hypothetical protein
VSSIVESCGVAKSYRPFIFILVVSFPVSAFGIQRPGQRSQDSRRTEAEIPKRQATRANLRGVHQGCRGVPVGMETNGSNCRQGSLGTKVGHFETIGRSVGLLFILLSQGPTHRQQVQQRKMERGEIQGGTIQTWSRNHPKLASARSYIYQGMSLDGRFNVGLLQRVPFVSQALICFNIGRATVFHQNRHRTERVY